ncbi:hypothetical protein ACWELQ_15660, partial [Nocardia sp. NPDC004722]
TTLVAVAGLVAATVLWRRLRRTDPTDRRTRRTLFFFGISANLVSLAMIAVATANTLTTAHPAPALAALFNGGW